MAPFIIGRLLALPREGEFVINRLPDTISKEFIDIRNALGLTCRFHDLRHSFATISLQNGDDIKTVSENLGHATVAFTLDVYGHVTAKMRRDSADRMQAFIESL